MTTLYLAPNKFGNNLYLASDTPPAQVLLTATLSASASISLSMTAKVQLLVSCSASASFTGNLTAVVTSVPLTVSMAAASQLTATLTVPPSLPAFVPSAARTISVLATSPVFTGSKWWNLTDTKKPRGLKDPEATIDITFDWSDWLTDIGEAAISEVTFTLKGGLNNVNTYYNGNKATVFVSGGVSGTPGSIACKIKTNTTPSRTDERTVYLDIGDE